MEEDHNQPLLCTFYDAHNPNAIDQNNSIIEKKPCSVTADHTFYNTSIIGFPREFYIELKKLWSLAGPFIFASVCLYGLGCFTQIFAGHLGTIQLAAISVENSVIADFGYSILAGTAGALDTLCGQAYGAKQYDMLGIYMQKSWFILTSATLGNLSLFIFATPVLKFLGQTATISTEAGRFALWMIPQQFAYALMIPTTKFLQAQRKVKEMALIAAVALSLHAFLGWFLILKIGWGLPGAALMLNSSWWFVAVAQFLYIISGSCGQTWPGFSWKALTNLSGFLKLSVLSALMQCLSTWNGMAVTLLSGYLKNAEVSVAALSICFNILGIATTVGTGFSAAVSVRVSNELGSGRSRAAKFAVMVVGIFSTLFGLLFALVLFLQRKHYPAIFSDDEQVKQLVEELTPLLGTHITFSCIPANGVAAGAGWQNFVAYMNIGCYFLIGAPLGIVLCFKFDLGLKGLWYGLLLGSCLQILGILLVVCLANWKKEAYAARKRLEQMGGKTLPQDDEET
ncbi:protein DETOXIFICATION 29 [Coffea arabica]|uniref:Protein DETOXIFICATION n=1 Tax=Coffea arabica TaxID=13443 RepID=A0A6P6VUY1_COFAR